MACTYDYNTGKITMDFHLIRHDEICNLRGIRTRVGAFGCKNCVFNAGTHIHRNCTEWEDYVKCKHPDAKDSEGSWAAWHNICEKFKEEALSYLDN